MEVWTVLFPILLTDVVNPVLFAFMVYAAGSETAGAAQQFHVAGAHRRLFLGGYFAGSVYGNDSSRFFQIPHMIDFVIELVLGFVLLWVAFGSQKNTGKAPERKPRILRLLECFRIWRRGEFCRHPVCRALLRRHRPDLKTDLSSTEVVLMLLSYNLAYALPFALVPVLSAAMGERAKPILGRNQSRSWIRSVAS